MKKHAEAHISIFPNVYENDRCVEYIKLDEEGNRIEVLLNASDEEIKSKKETGKCFSPGSLMERYLV